MTTETKADEFKVGNLWLKKDIEAIYEVSSENLLK